MLGRPYGLHKDDVKIAKEDSEHCMIIARKLDEGCTWDEAVRSLPFSEQDPQLHGWLNERYIVGKIARVFIHNLVNSYRLDFGDDPIGFEKRVCRLLDKELQRRPPGHA